MEWIILLMIMLALPGCGLLLLHSGLFAGIGSWYVRRKYGELKQ